MVVLVLKGLFFGGSETIIGEMNSKNIQKEKSNPIIVNIAPDNSGKQGSDSIGKAEYNAGNEASTEMSEYEKIFKMFQYLQKMQPFLAEAAIPRSQNAKLKLENSTFPFK